jgi:superfamily II DNA or RNA helicase
MRNVVAQGFKSICMQLGTGGGKTYIFSMITASAQKQKNSVWIIVPRIDLVDQASEHLKNMDVQHSHITAGRQESRAFNVHVVSKDTLIRRIKAGKIKNWPKIIIIDECHVAMDQQIFIKNTAPIDTLIIGVTATPERFDGRGLSEMYQTIVYGPTYRELVELDYLSNVRYFKPPEIKGLSDLKRVRTGYGIEYDAKQMKAIMKNKAVWGDIINNYREYGGPGKTTLIFDRSVEICEMTETNFQHAGHSIFAIHGKTSKKKRKLLFNAARNQEIDGLATCDLLTYGIDIKNIEFLMMHRFTGSYALYNQIFGRAIRPWTDPETGRQKKHAVIIDMVGNINQHGHPFNERQWNFFGTEKSKIEKKPSADMLKFCPACCLYFAEGNICPHCGAARKERKRGDPIVIDGRLVEAVPIKLNERAPEEKREYSDRMLNLKERYWKEINSKNPNQIIVGGIVKEYLEIADDLRRKPMWVYQMLNNLKYAINDPLLYEIQRIKGYKPGWVWMQKQQLKKR